jgi:hypothetical protein
MNDRYMVISPETLEAMRRAGHAAKLEARIEKLEAALRKIKDLHHGPEDDDVLWIRDDMTYKIVCDTLEGRDD